MEQYEFTDYAGDRLLVRPKLDGVGQESAAVIETCFRDTVDGQPVMVPAHRLAEVVAAMYGAAGQPVPDLPVIHDQAEVTWVATLLAETRGRDFGPAAADMDDARYLLAHGVRLPEATDADHR